MTDKKPTVQVVPATWTVIGSSLNPREGDLRKTGLTIHGGVCECKPITNAAQDSCVQPTVTKAKNAPPLQKDKEYYRLIDRAKTQFLAACESRWGQRTARLRHTLLSILEQLLHRGRFVYGERVGYSQHKLSEHLHRSPSTVKRALQTLRELPDLVRVIEIRPGDTAYDGEGARRGHLEFELGTAFGYPAAPTLPRPNSSCASTSAASAANSWTARNSCGGVGVARCRAIGSTVLPDHNRVTVLETSEQNLKLKNFSNSRSSAPRRNPTGTPTSKRREFSSRRAVNPPAPDKRSYPEQLIVQHRAVAEGKGPYLPIDANELEWATLAWEMLPGTPTQRLQRFAQISQMALEDSRRNGQKTAALKFTFAIRDDGYNPVLERDSRLRERREAAKKRILHSADGKRTRDVVCEPDSRQPSQHRQREQPASGPARSKPARRKRLLTQKTCLSQKEAEQRLGEMPAELREFMQSRIRGTARRAA